MRNTFWISFVVALFISAVIVANFDKDEFMDKMQASSLFAPRAEISELEFQEAFIDFIATYKKSYLNSYDFDLKYRVFKSNYQAIVDHNLRAEELGFELGVNTFADLTQEEFKAMYTGLVDPRPSFTSFLKGERPHQPHHKQPRHHRLHSLRTDLPDSIDWTAEGKVQKVKNQGSCGSCWAFSAIGALESAIAIKTGTLPDLSEQQLVDCSTGEGNMGCNGGWMDWAFEYGEKNAICTEAEYPYKGRDQTCQLDSGLTCSESYLVSDYIDVNKKDNDSLREGLAKGPVSIAVCAEGLAWQFYMKGTVSALCGACQDHGVLAVGYMKHGLFSSVDAIKIKNSWGSGWGEKGFIYVAAKPHETGNGVCGIYEQPSYPVV